MGGILFAVILGLEFALVGIPQRFSPWLPPNPIVGLLVAVYGVLFSAGVIYYGRNRESGIEERKLSVAGARPTEFGSKVEVTVVQNGPFKTSPYGSGWYERGSRINLIAFPTPEHPFKNWTCDTDLIEILNPLGASTMALAKGPGIVTANFF